MAEILFKTKPDALCAHLSALAERLGAGAKLPPVRVLGESLGVSTRTLHVALERLEGEGILSRRHGSGVYVSARFPAKGTGQERATRHIALVCNFQLLRSAGHSAFWDVLLEMAQGRAAQKNEACQLHLTNPMGDATEEMLDGLKAELSAGRFAGVLSLALNQPSVDWLIAQGLPLVTFAGWSPWDVSFDNDRLIELGVEVLKEQNVSRIGLWMPRLALHFMPDREEAGFLLHGEKVFRAALRRAGEKVRPSLVQTGADARESRQEQGYRIGKAVFSGARRTWPEGVVSTDDLLTRGALSAMRELGVEVGRDVRIASHANAGLPLMRDYEKQVTRLEVDPAALVQSLFDQLETLMAGQTPANPKVLIAPHVVLPS